MAFSLHKQLANDTIEVGDLPLCQILLMNDARFPWLILVPRREQMSEMFDLSMKDQQLLLQETSFVAERLKDLTGADKMNMAALGNQVPQLHVHVIARFKDDPAWPAPVWGNGKAVAYPEKEKQKAIADLQDLFAGFLVSGQKVNI
ncbi:HIT domain-containing protein [Methylophaga sp. OBS3]|uniref:HIT domain-containing protein n=1 Tax=Methylophaga sp. OBS3 TaxID=2991934 RepID=UPI002256B5D9|nr:HIT family protein [Methylophaga sp. OBS3]MCX4189355.1 HIT family protein [Methylophaga sp. OBS3]